MEHSSGRQKVAVLFGGRSLEHEISVLTAYQIMEALDSQLYQAIPVYIDPQGYWYTGPSLSQRKSWLPGPQLKDKLHRVVLLPGRKLELRPAGGHSWLPWRRSSVEQIDLVLPAVHGSFGEDGCLQGLLEMLNVPYVGPGPAAASISMHKGLTKRFAAGLDIPTVPSRLLRRSQWDLLQGDQLVADLLKEMPLPIICKPCNLGSSIGIAAARTPQELLLAIAAAFVLDDQLLLEPLLEEVVDLSIATLYGSTIRLSAIEQLLHPEGVLSFEDKYLRRPGKKEARWQGGLADAPRTIHPQLPAEVEQQVRLYATRFCEQLELRGAARIDFLYQPTTQMLWLNEVNPIPGSMAYYLWEAASPRLSFTQLLDELMQRALQDHAERERSQREAPWRIFQPEPTHV